MEAIILAGGLGTRLKSILPDTPKCLAPVFGRPFLFYIINHLRLNGVERFIFSFGYKHYMIERYLEDYFYELNYHCIIEDEPLGTGGAIINSLDLIQGEHVFVVNGDSLFKANYKNFLKQHIDSKSECSLFLKPMINFERYGNVEVDHNNRVIQFHEKKPIECGSINTGVYLLNRILFKNQKFEKRFSFENDYLEKYSGVKNIYGYTENAYFIDIGVPDDYSRAQIDFKPVNLDLSLINKNWTIFLDRDGVINKEIKNGYVTKLQEFELYDNILNDFHLLNDLFMSVYVVTNQKCIGLGLMSEKDLDGIHSYFLSQLSVYKATVDHFFYCSDIEKESPNRKPNPGMAFQAKELNPKIDFHKSLMVGNKLSDMKFGKSLGMFTVYIATTNPEVTLPNQDIDLRFESLSDFLRVLNYQHSNIKRNMEI